MGRLWHRCVCTRSSAALTHQFGLWYQETTLYILDRNRVLNASMLGPDYSAAVLAGRVSAGYEDGVGTEAAFYAPKGLVLAESLGAQGALFVSDFKAHRVRKIDIATQAVSSVAGYAWKPGSQDGVGTEACEKIFCLKANDLSTRESSKADLRTVETVLQDRWHDSRPPWHSPSRPTTFSSSSLTTRLRASG